MMVVAISGADAVDSVWRSPAASGWIPESRVSTPESTGEGAVIARLFQDAGWLLAGVASQNFRPAAGDAPRFARQHRIFARKDPEIELESAARLA